MILYPKLYCEKVTDIEVEYLKDASKFVSYKIKPQLKTLGPKYGKSLGKIRNFFETSFKGVGNPQGVPSIEEQFVRLYGEGTGDNIRKMVDIFIEKKKVNSKVACSSHHQYCCMPLLLSD